MGGFLGLASQHSITLYLKKNAALRNDTQSFLCPSQICTQACEPVCVYACAHTNTHTFSYIFEQAFPQLKPPVASIVCLLEPHESYLLQKQVDGRVHIFCLPGHSIFILWHKYSTKYLLNAPWCPSQIQVNLTYRAQSHLRRKSALKDCLDQIGLWLRPMVFF